jgi:hypothetical protein
LIQFNLTCEENIMNNSTPITTAEFESYLLESNQHIDSMSDNFNGQLDKVNANLLRLMKINDAGREALYYMNFDDIRQLAKDVGASPARSRDELLNNIMFEARYANSTVQRAASYIRQTMSKSTELNAMDLDGNFADANLDEFCK